MGRSSPAFDFHLIIQMMYCCTQTILFLCTYRLVDITYIQVIQYTVEEYIQLQE